MPYGLSPKLPLRIDPTDGYQLTKTYREMIKQNLKMLVLTCPGERMMDPVFGVGLRNFLFEQNTPATHGSIESTIRRQIGLYMPFIEVVDVSFKSMDDDPNVVANAVHVSLNYKIKPLDTYDELVLYTTSN
jgi:phage baseplate assembly protein W